MRADLATFLRRLVPPADDPASAWITHRDEGPDDMPAHIKAALLAGVAVDPGGAGADCSSAPGRGSTSGSTGPGPHRREVAARLA